MASDERGFEVLHAIRVRGFTDSDAIARALGGDPPGVEEQLDELSRGELIEHRDLKKRAGWLLKPAGTEQHADALARRRSPEFDAAVEAGYRKFMTVNRPMKELCSDWQMAGNPSAAGAVAEELEELSAEAHAAVDLAAGAAPWFAGYKSRLDEALALFAGGDHRFLISPLVDSYHTVWAECHEDFLVSLGRERTEQDE
jgi:hypothetical protein